MHVSMSDLLHIAANSAAVDDQLEAQPTLLPLACFRFTVPGQFENAVRPHVAGNSAQSSRCTSMSPFKSRMDIAFLIDSSEDSADNQNYVSSPNSLTQPEAKKLTPQASHNPGPSALPSPPFVYNDRSPLPRRFPCTVPGCQARFTRKHHMTSHLITHTEGKPFHCTVGPYCKASFRRLQDLRRHVKTVRHDL